MPALTKIAILPMRRFRVKKHAWSSGWYVQHFNNDTLRWEVYENISRTKVPIAKMHWERAKAVAVADRLELRYPWKDFDHQLFAARRRGDTYWPSTKADSEAVGQVLRERMAAP